MARVLLPKQGGRDRTLTHIWPYRSEQDNHPENGLLLRTDMHTLFDLNLMVIHPDTLAIHLDTRVRRHGYEDLGNLSPSREALRNRWKAWHQLR
ncbi:HNH endonuclease [Aestuariivirga sp.]|uniref:HNH endonuclease n=1 Tax=Aestuariivirga sp. TaxID=2650926 RepID=UPI0039196B38